MMRLALQGKANPVVLCLGAHCDDIEIGCGGTLLAIAEACPQAQLHCWVFSGSEPRVAETRCCLERLWGCERFSLVALGGRDGYFPADWAFVKAQMQACSLALAPDLVFTHTKDDSHQDHRTVAELTWNHFRNQLILEYEIAKFDGDLGRTNCYVPLTEGQLRRKVAALMASFPSQTNKPWFTESTFEALARLRGVECNAPSGHAEGFYLRKASLGF
ncbi:PIG-L deacetylase family protein [Hydrogenophaga sp.]|uniref:PIG-L deacetylase family protein n=1 Tax=Hydrogenophaga sp. TaxID=1904254 RepID=UPI003F6B91BE